MAVAVPSGVIIAWPGTAASIPANWSRVANLDDRFIKGTAVGVEPDVTGGADTHTHASPSHLHTYSSHAHTSNPGFSGTVSPLTWDAAVAFSFPIKTHTHTVPDLPTNVGGNVSAATASFQTGSSLPSWLRVIWIQSDGVDTGIPDGAIAIWPTSSLPTNWIQNVNAKNVYLRGAAPAGDGGGTGGGGTHLHVADAHTHGTGHAHTAVTSGAAVGLTDINNPGTDELFASPDHTHTVNISASGTIGDATSASSSADAVEPVFQKLAIVENDTGGLDLPPLMICGWLGTLASIPTNWILCDGASGSPDLRGVFVKGANLLSEIGDIGGASTHDHTDPVGHVHAQSHTHVLVTAANVSGQSGGAAGAAGPIHDHTHPSHVSAAGGSGNSGSGIQTVDTVDHQPAFRTVAYIQFLGDVEVQIDDPTHQEVVLRL